MALNGGHIIASSRLAGKGALFAAVDPVKNCVLEPQFHEATEEEVDQAVTAASSACDAYRCLPLEQRAQFLEAIVKELNADADDLISRAHCETALPIQRLQGELLRTTGQLKLFAEHVRQANFLGVRIDRAEPERKPSPKPDIRTINVPLGPVAVFGASNFPLAFSVAGGDTASALAAGCPVVVKGHPAHPGTGELAGAAISRAVAGAGVPPGTFSLLQGAGEAVGTALVQHPSLKAVAFTGSLAVGRALFELACARLEPIPFYAEMGSINPVFLLPSALQKDSDARAEGLAASLTMGVGQFCTAPGLVVVKECAGSREFIASLTGALGAVPEGTMLHRGIKKNFLAAVNRLNSLDGVQQLSISTSEQQGCNVSPVLFQVDAACWLKNPQLAEEVFGPAAIVVNCPSGAEMLDVAEHLPGQLTATIHGDEPELADNADLLKILERKVGRLVINGYPTGVEVCHSMHHGGPYPASTDCRSTSVGTEAMMRFLRPVCYQDTPRSLLPGPLQD